MASRSPLTVWLYEHKIGTLSEPRFGSLRFDFDAEAEAHFRPGSVVLSTSMPLDSTRRPRGETVRAFFDGLMPEGSARVTLARTFEMRLGDDFGLLSAIGRDCAGAVVLQPPEEPAPTGRGRLERLADGDLERLIAGLAERPLGADEHVRVSLAGVQEKLLLARADSGEWARPLDGAPSTHILKPQDMRLDCYAAAEAFCLRLARGLGLTNVDVEVFEVSGRPVLAVSRYDRSILDGRIVRIHQEDACQALGVDTSMKPDRKYQSSGGPNLKSVAQILGRFGTVEDRSKLLAVTTLNVAVGNADNHSKNLSILHDVDGTVRLAPTYDVTPTTFYRGVETERGLKDLTDELGLWVNGRRSVHKVTTEDLVAEARTWGVRERDARAVVGQTLANLKSLIPEASGRTEAPEMIAEYVSGRVTALLSGGAAGS